MKSLKTILILCLILSFSGIYQVNGQWTTSGSNIYNTNAGNVGIGNNTPATLLHVGKNMIEPTIRIQNLGGTGGATFQMVDNVSGADWKFKATNAGGFKIRDNAAALDVIQIEPNSASNSLYINSLGQVGIANSLYVSSFGNAGIGTSIPAAKLDVKTTSSYVAQFNGTNPMYIGLFENDTYRGYLGSYSGSSTDVDFGTGAGNTSGSLHLTIQANPKLTITAAGDVGIGTTAPSAKLHINGGDLFVNSATGLIVFGYTDENQWQLATTGAGADLRWYTTTDGGGTVTPRHYFSQNGNVGIGGFSGPGIPEARLEVIGSGYTMSTNTFMLKNSNGDTLMRVRDDGRIGIGFNGTSYGRTINLGGTGINFYTANEAAFGGAVWPTDTSLVLYSNSGVNNYLILQPSWGNVGIGTYSPDYKFHVNGVAKLGALIVGQHGIAINEIVKATVAKDLPSISANSTTTQTFSVANASVSGSVVISPENALPDGLVIAFARVSVSGTVEVKFTNVTGAAINPAIMDFYITVIE